MRDKGGRERERERKGLRRGEEREGGEVWLYLSQNNALILKHLGLGYKKLTCNYKTVEIPRHCIQKL